MNTSGTNNDNDVINLATNGTYILTAVDNDTNGENGNRSWQETSALNFRNDFNVDGRINSGDATIVRSRSGHFIP